MKNLNLKQIIKEEILKILSETEEKKTWIVKFRYRDGNGKGNGEEEIELAHKPTLSDVKEKYNRAYGSIENLHSVEEKKSKKEKK